LNWRCGPPTIAALEPFNLRTHIDRVGDRHLVFMLASAFAFTKRTYAMNQELDVLDDVLLAKPERGSASESPARSDASSAGLLGGAAALGTALTACGGGGAEVAATSAAAPLAADAAGASSAAQAQALSGGQTDAVGSAMDNGHGPTDAKANAAANSRSSRSPEQIRFILQAQFGATPADLTSVRNLGYSAWLDRQFNAPASEGGYDWMVSSGNTDPFKGEFFFPQFADFMIWKQLISSPDQVRMRMALALSEMFVVSTNALDAFWPGSFMGAYWDVLTKNAFGNFRNLLEDVTLNPAMGRYLNMKGSLKEDAATGRLPDENYAREIMQLFTIGLNQLNLDGTPKLDAQGKKLDSYTQSDVSNLARVFTGYDYDYTDVTYTNTRFEPYPIPSPQNARNRMKLFPDKHSKLSATFLGVTVPANTPGLAALKIALDTLFNHPNVGPFFAKQMIQRLVTSNPSPAYVQRVATAFNNNGAGVRGDMKAFWKALLLDVEARMLSTAPSAGKVREPMVRAVQWARTFGGTSVDGKWELYQQDSSDYGLAHSPLRSPSVFNFYRPGYVPPKTAIAAAGLVAPEFQIHNESSTVSYLNYLSDWVGDKFGYGAIVPNYSALLPIAADVAKLVDWVNLYLTANQLSANTVKLINESVASLPVTASSPDPTKLQRVYAAVLLVMACPEYIVQK
jgi:uncharacterized protein (DUF1800 family)